MNKRKAINLAINAMNKYMSTYYGWSARYDKEDKKIWDEYVDAIKLLKELRDNKPYQIKFTDLS